jgi:hypothetical protein
MALPTQNWRMLQPVYVGPTLNAVTGGIAGVLDAIYAMGTATVYADGSARTPGTGSAWTWNLDNTTFATGATTAVYASPPTTTAINQQIILAGTTNTTGAAWKQLYDTRNANLLFGGIAKGTGAYTSWNNPTTPFTTGDFTGFSTAGGNGGGISNAFGYVVYMLECQETVAVYVVAPSGTTFCGGWVMGAFCDPLSANPLNAETDGRLYGITTSGLQGVLSSSWLATAGSSGSSGTLFSNSTTGQNAHAVVFTPGAGTILVVDRFAATLAPGVGFTSRNGDLPQVPLQLVTGNQFLGQLRQMFITRDTTPMVAWESGGVVKGYMLGGPTSTTSDVLLLTY